MAKKIYSVTTTRRAATPRSSRRRNTSQTAGGGGGVVQVTPSGPSSGDGHTHDNLPVLDALSMDEQGYLHLRRREEEAAESVTEKVKAGFADKAKDAEKAAEADKAKEATRALEAEKAKEADKAKDADKWSGHTFGDYLDQPVRKSDGVAFKKVSAGTFQTPEFASGMTGKGGRMDEAGNAELRSLILRAFLETPELRYNRTEVSVGDEWKAPGYGLVESVDTDQQIVTLKLEEGEIGAVDVGDICMGIFHHLTTSENATEDADDGRGNRTFAGFSTSYFQITEVYGSLRSSFKYEQRPVSNNYPVQHHPSEAMTFVTYGSFTNAGRRSSKYATRTYERYLRGVDDWEFMLENIAAQFGDLSNLSIFGLDMAGYSAYLDNIYMQGMMQSIDKTFVVDTKTKSLLLASPDTGVGLAFNPQSGLRIGAVYDSETGKFSEEYDLKKIALEAAEGVTKNRNFTSQPEPPYRIGDLWAQGGNGGILRCKTTRLEGKYSAEDWEPADNYYSYVDNKVKQVTNTVAEIVNDDFVTPSEKKKLRELRLEITSEYEEAMAEASKYRVIYNALTEKYNAAIAALVKYTDSGSANITVADDYVDIEIYLNAAQSIREDMVKDAADAASRSTREREKIVSTVNRIRASGVVDASDKEELRLLRSQIIIEYPILEDEAQYYVVDTANIKTRYNMTIAALDKYTAVAPAEITVSADLTDIALYHMGKPTVKNSIALAAEQRATSWRTDTDAMIRFLRNIASDSIIGSSEKSALSDRVAIMQEQHAILVGGDWGSALLADLSTSFCSLDSLLARVLENMDAGAEMTYDEFWNLYSIYIQNLQIVKSAIASASYTKISDMDYLKALFGKGSTDILGGAVLSSFFGARDDAGNVNAMFNGSARFVEADHGVAMVVLGIPQTEAGLAEDWKTAQTRMFQDGHVITGSMELLEGCKIGPFEVRSGEGGIPGIFATHTDAASVDTLSTHYIVDHIEFQQRNKSSNALVGSAILGCGYLDLERPDEAAISVRNGYFEGYRLKTAPANTYGIDLSDTQTVYVHSAASVGGVNLPRTPKIGQRYEIIKVSSYQLEIYGSGRNILLLGGGTKTPQKIAAAWRGIIHLQYDGVTGFWIMTMSTGIATGIAD